MRFASVSRGFGGLAAALSLALSTGVASAQTDDVSGVPSRSEPQPPRARVGPLRLHVTTNGHPFDRAKLERAISHSCRKRDIDPAKVDQLISGVQRQMETLGDEVTSARIGEAVMAGLKSLDHVAYIRFASIYKDFSEPGDFAEIAERVEKEAIPPGHNKLL